MNKKTLIIVVVVLVVAASALGTILMLRSGEASDQLAVLSMKEGDVFVSRGGTDNWVEAKVGLGLYQADAIKVADNSRAEITFFEGSIIELGSGTVLNISDINIAADTGSTTIMLNQEVGRTVSRVKKLVDQSSRYEIETAAGSATVRDSIMVVEVDVEGNTVVYNEEGSISAIAQGEEVHIPEGMQSVIIPGQAPSLPSRGGEGAGLIRITKSIKSESGDTVTYIYEVTNLGDTPQSNVYVMDDEVDVITFEGGDNNNNDMLDPSETWIFTGN